MTTNHQCELPGCGKNFKLEGLGWAYYAHNKDDPKRRVFFCSAACTAEYEKEQFRQTAA